MEKLNMNDMNEVKGGDGGLIVIFVVPEGDSGGP